MKLILKKPAYARVRPDQLDNLGDDEKVRISAGTLDINWDLRENLFVKVELVEPLRNRFNWYFFVDENVEIEGTEVNNKPKDGPLIEAFPSIQVPGISRKLGLKEPIFTGANFTWGELTHGGTRIPQNEKITRRIIRITETLQEIRQFYGGRPITINSGYRPPNINRMVGGASKSRHLVGDAVDFVVAGVHPYQVYKDLDSWHGNSGGLASSTVFTHIDNRGYRARWSYGF